MVGPGIASSSPRNPPGSPNTHTQAQQRTFLAPPYGLTTTRMRLGRSLPTWTARLILASQSWASAWLGACKGWTCHRPVQQEGGKMTAWPRARAWARKERGSSRQESPVLALNVTSAVDHLKALPSGR